MNNIRNPLRKASTKILNFTRGLSLRSSTSDIKNISDAVWLMNAKELYYKGDFIKSQTCFEKVKEMFKDNPEKKANFDEVIKFLLLIYERTGKDYMNSCNFHAALASFEKLKEIKEEKSDSKGVKETLEVIAGLYKAISDEAKGMGNQREAIASMEKRKSILEELNKSLHDVYIDLEELYTAQAHQLYHQNNYKKAIESYEKLKDIYYMKNNTRELLEVYGILGKLYSEINQIRSACQYFTKLKDLAEYKQNYQKKMHALKNLGICYQLMKDYSTALINFKQLLQLAWKEKNIEMELIAYDYMSIQYFYLGDLDGARYYNDRIWKGVTEKFTSPVRELSNKALEASKNREKIQIRGTLERSGSIKKGNSMVQSKISLEFGLPSPRTSSGATDQQFLPIFTAPVQPVKPPHRRLSTNKASSQKSLNKTTEVKTKNAKNEANPRTIKPFILLSHLSPIESVKNYFYPEYQKT